VLRELRHGLAGDERRAELEEALPEVAQHTSAMERRAQEAERELLQWKKVRFMTDKIGDVYGGYITGVAAYGLFVQMTEHFVEGLVHVSTLVDDFYRFDEAARVLLGERSKRIFRLGDVVRVRVLRVDMDRRQVELGIEEVLDVVARDQRARGARPSAARPRKGRRAPPRAGARRRDGKRERSAKKRGRR
jgi:ribonuclease R